MHTAALTVHNRTRRNELGHSQAHEICHHDSISYQRRTAIRYHKNNGEHRRNDRSTVRCHRGVQSRGRQPTSTRCTAQASHSSWCARHVGGPPSAGVSISGQLGSPLLFHFLRLERHPLEVTTPRWGYQLKCNAVDAMLIAPNGHGTRESCAFLTIVDCVWLLAECLCTARDRNVQESALCPIATLCKHAALPILPPFTSTPSS